MPTTPSLTPPVLIEEDGYCLMNPCEICFIKEAVEKITIPMCCGSCSGSGEGMWDGSTCRSCGGGGEVGGVVRVCEKCKEENT